MKWKLRPKVWASYINGFMEDVTGKDIRAIKMQMRRKGFSRKQYLEYYFKKHAKNSGAEGSDSQRKD